MYKKNLFRLALICIVVLSLSACNMNREGAMDNNRDDNNMQTNEIAGDLRNNDLLDADRQDMRPWNDRFGNNGDMNGMHNNSSVEKSREIADKIAAMDQVESANVLLTDENAYIAVVLDNQRNDNGNGNGVNGNRMFNRNGNDGTDNGQRGSDLEMGEYGMGEDISARLKDQISNKVKSLKPDVDNVYISANPDFLDRMNNFIDQIDDGRPVRGFINEFNTMVQRIFPDNAARNR